MNSSKIYVILVAGGAGRRLGGMLPKQFIIINGKPVIIHTLDKFKSVLPNAQIIVSINEEWKGFWTDMLNNFNVVGVETVLGGQERFHSVKNALDAISEVYDNDIVLVHDAVRPVISTDLINNVVDSAAKYGTAIPYLPVEQSMRKLIEGFDKTVVVDRNEYIQIQTPQGFLLRKLKAAYESRYKVEFTDDASVFEKAGNSLHFIKGERTNIKITYPEDVLLAKKILE